MPGPADGAHRDADELSLPTRLVCMACRKAQPLTKAAAEAAVASGLGQISMYECEYGLGWHLRAIYRKAADPDA